ncbi:MAG: peroxiredoxin [Planctomycetota bacterium]
MSFEQMPLRLPALNEPAPDFDADTTLGRRRLEDYVGRWLVLFSHPADFTPVCTTEFAAFARLHDRFLAIGCDLLGLSIDSVYAHIAWLRSIQERLGVEVGFPVIADSSMRVAHAYGMIHPGASDTSAVRATFVIDPDGILRAMVYYPMTNGRSVPEILRLVQALRTSATHHVATPEGWQPGDSVLRPPPSTLQELAARESEHPESTDWYLARQDLPERDQADEQDPSHRP